MRTLDLYFGLILNVFIYHDTYQARDRINESCGAVAERLRRRSREQNVPSSIPRLGISIEVTS